jgi:hypothetical protein
MYDMSGQMPKLNRNASFNVTSSTNANQINYHSLTSNGKLHSSIFFLDLIFVKF